MSEVQYIPEIDYKARNFAPLKGPPPGDLCGNCISYYEGLYKAGLTKNPFPPNCKRHISGIAESLNPADFRDNDEYELAKIISDPISWAYAEFEWEPRWYQERILSCTSDKKLVRGGRRSGKSEAMVIEILFEICTNDHHTVLVIAPSERLVSRFFDEMRKFIKKSQNITNSIARSTKGPNLIELKNGSKALGFSAGPASSNGADKIRGQDAHLIIIDELDFIKEKDVDAIMAILASHPEARIIAASTPQGWRKKFFSYVVNKDIGYKEFWFISAENPSWTVQQEDYFKNSYSEAAFTHEFLADFGDLEDGVFKRKHIDKSIQVYNYSDTPEPGKKHILGIDWNKSAGTHMVIMEWDNSRLKLVNKIIVPESEYMQTESVNEIIRLHSIWNFRHIFADAGYGTAQIEMIKKHGQKNPATRLAEITQALHMNQNVEILDPITAKPVKKFAKQFIVQQTVKLLEDGAIILPKSEDTISSVDNKQMGLIQQMRNYRVENYSIYGLARFSQGEDHTLTAFMIACACFVLEEGDLKEIEYSTRMIGVPVSSTSAPEFTSTEKERLEDARKYRLEMTTGKANTSSKPVGVRDLDVSSRKYGDNIGRPMGFKNNSSRSLGGSKRRSF
jgi:thymidine kinase